MLMMRRGQSFQETESPEVQKARFSSFPFRRFVPILCITAFSLGLGWILLKYGTNVQVGSLSSETTVVRTGIVFLLIMMLSTFDLRAWHGVSDRSRYFYAFVLGTVMSFILIALKRSFFETGVGSDPFLLALGMVILFLGWKFLFGPWNVSIKATVLGTFLFWVVYAILRYKTGQELLATGIAAACAIIPVIIWCQLFLQYHKENRSIIFLAFFAGMLSTVPILFLNELTVRGMELNFFLFKITPINFQASSQTFVRQSIFQHVSGTGSIVLSTFVTYLLVGVIEEVSKFWVLKNSSTTFFRSIDDVLQLSIIVALGFAFAENLANPTYFIGFVQQYLFDPPSPEWGQFIGNVFGRSVLTSMVHILSTGVMGYFVGLAFFSSSVLRDQFAAKKFHPILETLHRIASIDSDKIYRKLMMVYGFAAAILLHGFFDFIVTLPEVVPGNPTTVGALLGLVPSSFLHALPLTLLPSLFYVIGGFWILTYLFEKKENMKEFGQVIESETVIDEI
jgi:hypothetical protein